MTAFPDQPTCSQCGVAAPSREAWQNRSSAQDDFASLFRDVETVFQIVEREGSERLKNALADVPARVRAAVASRTPAEGETDWEVMYQAETRISAKQAAEIVQLRAQIENARAQAIEECADYLEQLGARFHSGRDIVQRLRMLAYPSTVRAPE